MHHHSNGFIRIKVGFAVKASQAEQCLLGLLAAALSDEPPWRFRCKEDTNAERQRPHPLQGIGDTICPFIVASEHGTDNTNTNLLAEAPAEVDIGGQIATEGHRADLGRIGDGESLKDTPWNAAQNLSDEQGLDILGGKEDGCEARDTDEAGTYSISIPKAL